MMYCSCKIKQLVKRSAGGIDFLVCAKSKNGCGKEIIDFEVEDGKVSEKPLTKTIEVKLDEQTCPACYGAGRFYNADSYSLYGDECETCQGYGKVK